VSALAALVAQVPPGGLATALQRILGRASAAVAAADRAQAKRRRARAALTTALQALATLRARLATRRAARLIGAEVRTQLEAAVDQARADAKKLRATFTAAGSGA
jgi:hypothetical protein